MARVRISTTVDNARLERARRLSGVKDSELLDRALVALIEELEAERERAALQRHPYDEDDDVSWDVPLVALPYDGDVPAEVQELARQRREAK